MQFEITRNSQEIICQRKHNIWGNETRCSHLINLDLHLKVVHICATYHYGYAHNEGMVPVDGECCGTSDFLEALELCFNSLITGEPEHEVHDQESQGY